MEYEVGQKVWIHLPWVDDECWVSGTVLKTTAKRIKCSNDVRTEGYYLPKHIKPRD